MLVALGVALALPYVTVVLLRSGEVGFLAFGSLFVAVVLLVVVSDLREGEDAPVERE